MTNFVGKTRDEAFATAQKEGEKVEIIEITERKSPENGVFLVIRQRVENGVYKLLCAPFKTEV